MCTDKMLKMIILCGVYICHASFSNFTHDVANRVSSGVDSIKNDVENVINEAETDIKSGFNQVMQKIEEPVNEMKSKASSVNLSTLVKDVEKGPKKVIHEAKQEIETMIKKAKAKVKADIQGMFIQAALAAKSKL